MIRSVQPENHLAWPSLTSSGSLENSTFTCTNRKAERAPQKVATEAEAVNRPWVKNVGSKLMFFATAAAEATIAF